MPSRLFQAIRQSLGIDSNDKLKVSLYGKETNAGDTEIPVHAQSGVYVATIRDFTAADGLSNTVGLLNTISADAGRILLNALASYNGSTWDRYRNNEEITLLASAARTGTTNSSDQTNYNGRGVIITLDVTAISATPSITLAIEHKDLTSGKYEKLLDAPAVTAVGTHTYIVYPGAGAAAEDVVENQGFPLGRTWRVTVTHADADSITYSVGASYIL